MVLAMWNEVNFSSTRITFDRLYRPFFLILLIPSLVFFIYSLRKQIQAFFTGCTKMRLFVAVVPPWSSSWLGSLKLIICTNWATKVKSFFWGCKQLDPYPRLQLWTWHLLSLTYILACCRGLQSPNLIKLFFFKIGIIWFFRESHQPLIMCLVELRDRLFVGLLLGVDMSVWLIDWKTLLYNENVQSTGVRLR